MITVVIALAAIVVALAVVVLTLMREVVITRGEIYALSQVIIKPPDPSMLDQPLPPEVSRLLPVRAEASTPDRFVLFLADDCGACKDLANDLAALAADLQSDLVPVLFAAVIRGPALARPTGIERALTLANVTVSRDETGGVFDACQIWGTPTIALVRGPEQLVVEASAGPTISWVSQRLPIFDDSHDHMNMNEAVTHGAH